MNNTLIDARIAEMKINKSLKIKSGEGKILKAYIETQSSTDSDILVVNDFLFKNEFNSAYKALKDNRVEEFILNDRSSGLMQTLQYLLKKGCEIKGSLSYVKFVNVVGRIEEGLLIKLP